MKRNRARNRQAAEGDKESSDITAVDEFLRRFKLRKELEIKHGFTAGA